MASLIYDIKPDWNPAWIKGATAPTRSVSASSRSSDPAFLELCEKYYPKVGPGEYPGRKSPSLLTAALRGTPSPTPEKLTASPPPVIAPIPVGALRHASLPVAEIVHHVQHEILRPTAKKAVPQTPFNSPV